MPVDEMPLKLLRLIAANPRVSQRDVALEVGISLGKVNYCLRALVHEGYVRAVRFKNSRNKVAYRYLLTPRGFAHKAVLTARCLRSKMREYESLRSEIEELRRESGPRGSRTRNAHEVGGEPPGGRWSKDEHV